MADQATNPAPTKPYEVLDSGMAVGGRLVQFGAKVDLADEQAAALEPYGSIRPWGEDDHDLVDDERDLPGILASAGGRERLARDRMEKRSKGTSGKTSAPPEPMDKGSDDEPAKRPGRRA